MTDIEKKALEQAVAAAGRRMQDYAIMAEENVLRQSIDAHARAIEQHEAFRQEVSDAVEKHIRMTDEDCSSLWRSVTRGNLSRFIITKPVDPLVEVMNEMGFGMSKTASEDFRAALAARGLEIREKQ